MFPIDFGDKKSSTLDIEVEYGFHAHAELTPTSIHGF
jgi:hypothetical protein